ncbi:MAG: hypothetical protein Tsb0020_26230 [Haliangiales bacterium]
MTSTTSHCAQPSASISDRDIGRNGAAGAVAPAAGDGADRDEPLANSGCEAEMGVITALV